MQRAVDLPGTDPDALDVGSAAAYWLPDYLDDSAWREHAPFLFWLIQHHHPQSFVELGVGTGYSYFAACQAVQRLGLTTNCYAVDWWKGDEHAGFVGPEVFERFKAYHDSRYAGFSQILRSTFDEALPYFVDGSVDLLHIDGRHFYDDVRHDFESWRPKLSNRAIVLFHDTNVRERDFGVFRFWAELAPNFPHFEFLHGNGLGVLGVGRDLPERVSSLFRAYPERAGVLRAIYARLGGSLTERRELERLKQEILDKERRFEEERHAFALKLGELDEESKSIGAERLEWRRRATQQEQKLAIANAKLRDLKQEAALQQTEQVQLQAALSRREGELETLNQSYAVRLARRYVWRVSHRLPLGKALRRLRGERKAEPELRGHIETDLSPRYVGNGLALVLCGWCYSTGARIRRLTILADGVAYKVPKHSLPRADVWQTYAHELEQPGNALCSGFKALLPLAGSSEMRRTKLVLGAELTDGRRLQLDAGEVSLLPGQRRSPVKVTWPSEGAKVAIVMATWEPPRALFAEQIESLRAQTHRNFVVIISDDGSAPEQRAAIKQVIGNDPRFVLLCNETRLGFYGNFERCLEHVPADAEFVALCDQDDRWASDKLETLLGAMRPGVMLAYSDMVIVAEDGHEICPSFSRLRPDNSEDFAALLVANTITGAASLFRAELLTSALPFPERLGHGYHDHWLGLVARTKGSVAFVERPLHFYVQHGDNVIGHVGALKPARSCEALRRALTNSGEATGFLERLKDAESTADFILHKAVLATTLLLREPKAVPATKRVLERFRHAAESLPILVGEAFRAKILGRQSLKTESQMLCAEVSSRIVRGITLLRRRQLAHALGVQDLRAPSRRNLVLGGESSITWIMRNLSPLRLAPSPRAPRRVNLLLQMIDFRYVFGGYLAMFNLALRLKRDGMLVRIVLLERGTLDLKAWRKESERYGELKSLFDEIEIVQRYDRDIPLDVSPDDAFVATSCWSAHVAHHAVRELKRERFVFLVQEYEPVFVPMNTINALFRQAYDLPHFAVFSTDLLRGYFEAEQIGLFATSDGASRSVTFRNAIHHSKVTAESLARSSRRLLFYARPEEHAARNLFELGTMALAELVSEGDFDVSRWSFHGLGSIDTLLRIDLGRGVELKLLPRLSLQEYQAVLPTFDVGLSLMLTPHPSLVPLEMAAAGMKTVTNVFANKTAERLLSISSNLVPVAPTVHDIKSGLRRAMTETDDIDGRVRGAEIEWPGNWEEAFDESVMSKLRAFLA